MFDISCFSVTAVHEQETPSVTTNWQICGHPYNARNERTTVENQGDGTVEISQQGGQAFSCATVNENQCQVRAAQAEAAVVSKMDAMKQAFKVREAAVEETATAAERSH